MKNSQSNDIAEGKTTAIIAYITIIGLIIAFVQNNDKKNDFAFFHIRQSLGLVLTGMSFGIIGIIPILGWFINIIGILLVIYLWITGLMNAMNGKDRPVPFLGVRFEEWFKGIK